MPSDRDRRRIIVEKVVAGDRRINLDFILENPVLLYIGLTVAEFIERFVG